MRLPIERLWDRVREHVISVLRDAWNRAVRPGGSYADAMVLLFSGGKDSGLILAAMLDHADVFDGLVASAHLGSLDLTHIIVTGNSHPANTYCAAACLYYATRLMTETNEQLLSTRPVLLARGEAFQAYVAKYGLKIGPRRWCWLRFKYEVFYNWLLEQYPCSSGHVVIVDGMSPSDRAQRRNAIREPVEKVELSNGYRFIATHPLYHLDLDDDTKLELLRYVARRHKVLECIVKLYEVYGDSMNCVLCPYKTPKKLLRNVVNDPVLREALASFIETALRGEHWQGYARLLHTPAITQWITSA